MVTLRKILKYRSVSETFLHHRRPCFLKSRFFSFASFLLSCFCCDLWKSMEQKKMDRVQIVAYLPEYYADFIHLFRQGWWENVPRAMIIGITNKKFIAFIFTTSCILAGYKELSLLTFTFLVSSLILARISCVYFCYFKSKSSFGNWFESKKLKFYTTWPNILWWQS